MNTSSSILSFFLLALISSVLAKVEVKPYSYNPALPNGPADWQSVDPAFATCGSGTSQSPIDIPFSVIKGSPLNAPTVNKTAGIYSVKNSTVNFELQCTSSSCGSLSINNSSFNLINVHFHSPSEHTHQHKRYPLEAHLVHQDDQGQLAVVSILFDYGRPNRGVETVLRNLQSESFSLSTDLLQRGFSSYCRYSGSLTTPPCTEQVNWILTRKISTVSADQIKRYAKNIGVDGISETFGNNRPVLSRNGRDVTCF